MAAFLGVLKAAHLFVPLNPLYPRAQLHAILEDAQARRVLTNDRLRPDLNVAFAEPRTPIEAALSRIWTEALDLDRVGIHERTPRGLRGTMGLDAANPRQKGESQTFFS